MNDQATRTGKPSVLNRPVTARAGCLVLGGVALLLLSGLTGTMVLWEIPVRLLTGWFFFIADNLTSLEVNREMAACGTGALVLATYGLHRSILWLRADKRWRWPWTISVTALMLSLFAASVAMTGIVHQLAWMAREPLTQSNKNYPITVNTNSAKQLFYLLVEYDGDDGGYPPSLDHLVAKGYVKAETMREFLFRPAHGGVREPWIYLGAGTGTDGELDSLPLLVSPHPLRDRWIVLQRDGAVKQLPTEMFQEEYPGLLDRLPHLIQRE